MKQVVSDIIMFRGSHADFGFYQGKLLRHSPILDARKKQWSSKSRHFIIDRKKIEPIFNYFSPGIWQELIGLAEALQMDMETAIREFGGYYLEYGKSGCSIFSDSNYMIRNYDNAPSTYEGRYVFYQPADGGYATIGPSMQITGRTDGLNEKGLAMGYNFVNRLRSDDGFVCNMIGRLVLENCATVDEAVALLKELPHRHSFSYSLLDKSGKHIVVEASANEVRTRDGQICTNHFEKLTNENRYRMDDSLQRYEAIYQQQPVIETPYDAFRLMNDIDKGVFSNKYGAWAGTIHTAAYLPQQMQAWIALGGDQPPLIFNFNKWLFGEKLYAKQIKGKLDANHGFINV
ncbi:C45 family autoproteolytic acyltransferase/hydolase [Oceanobacillus sp. FSL H7-0719]|uniref:C45 family autoproteolytic acyltransferase/hydolase n=1 Tax=Oceanobacillus sp. FSL H7-0719 TaxID=2954507 RepID=UPI00324FD00E